MIRPRSFVWLATFLAMAPLMGVCAEESSPTPKVEAPAPPARTSKQLATDAAAQKLLNSLLDEVAEIRGLPWKHPVPVAVISRDELRKNLIQMMDEDYPADERARDDRILKRIGLLRDEEDITEMSIRMYTGTVAGYFNNQDKKMYLIEGPLGQAQIPTLVHELIHALDDQHYDFEKMEEPYQDDMDRFFAGRCVMEGCAEVARIIYEERHADISRKGYEYEVNGRPTEGKDEGDILPHTPAFLLLPTLLHYRSGPSFVARAVKDEFAKGMKALYEHPPTTQEQVLHPERWLDPSARDLPRLIHWPDDFDPSIGKGWILIYEHPLGELDLAMQFAHLASIPNDKHEKRARPLPGSYGRLTAAGIGSGRYLPADAHAAALGWDAGHVKYYARDDQTPLAVISTFAFDSANDANEAFAAFERSYAARYGREWTIGSKQVRANGTKIKFHCPHGLGILEARDNIIRCIDGAISTDMLTRVWNKMQAIRFTQQEGDAGDTDNRVNAVPDPFLRCTFVDRRRGLGLNVPNEWKVRPSDGKRIALVATLGRKDVVVTLLSQATGVVSPNLIGIAKQIAPGSIKGDGRKITFGHAPGRAWAIPSSGGVERQLAVGSDGVQTHVAMIAGPSNQVWALQREIDKLLADLVCVPGY